MSRTENPRVLITGASSGIGAALAENYARRGARLLLLARRSERLAELAERLRVTGAEVSIQTADVTHEGAVARAIADWAGESGIDIVIANAGYSVTGPLTRLTLADYRRQFETNVFGVLRTVQESLPALRAAHGRLVIIGSVAGYVAAPGASAYAMSKFAVRALAESLRGELGREGIGVTLVSPAYIDSDIRRTDNRGLFHAGASDPIPAWLRMRTPQAARVIVRAIARGQDEVIVTFHGKLLVFIARHFHRTLRTVVRRIGWRPEARTKD
jgi:short-subunit dehydrogenase